MKRLILSLLLVLLLASSARGQQTPVLISVHFNTSTSVIIQWEQPPGVSQTCLLRHYGSTWPAGICWHDLPAGHQIVELPGILSHPAYRPAWGDRYELRFENEVAGTATLGESVIYTTYLPLMQRATPLQHRTYLPVVY